LEAFTPKFISVSDWCALSGVKRSRTYELLGLGYLSAVKAGRRTLIDVEAGLAWLHSLPRATFQTPKAAAIAGKQTMFAAPGVGDAQTKRRSQEDASCNPPSRVGPGTSQRTTTTKVG
jgi:hypothetical protein